VYEVQKKIGRGRFSEVFQGVNMKTGDAVVLKSLKPLTKKKVLREKFILDKLKNCENVINLQDIVKDDLSRTISFVFEYVETEFYKDQYSKFTDHDVRLYMYLCFKVIKKSFYLRNLSEKSDILYTFLSK
jgi:casein kinase II subunit alpha